MKYGEFVSRAVAWIIFFNVMLGVAFVFSSYYIWYSLEEYPYTTAHWSPFTVSYVQRNLVDGELVSITAIRFIPNYPFWLFWVAMAVNLYFIVRLERSGGKKSSI